MAVLLTLIGGTVRCAPAGEQGAQREESAADAGGGSTTASGATDQAGSPEDWIEGFAVGFRVDTGGTIPPDAHGQEFRPGQPIYVSMEIGEAPPAASVHAIFLDAAGRKVAEDAKKVPSGAGHLYFDSGDTSDWTPGEGTITIAVDGRQVTEEPFTLLEAAPAEPAGAQTPPSG